MDRQTAVFPVDIIFWNLSRWAFFCAGKNALPSDHNHLTLINEIKLRKRNLVLTYPNLINPKACCPLLSQLNHPPFNQK